MAEKYLDTETRRQQIAEAVLKILSTDGIEGVTAANVARHVGIVPSAIYRHFSDKSAMVDAAIDIVKQRILLNAAKARSSGREPLEMLHELLSHHIDMVVKELGAGGSFLTIEIAYKYPDKRKRIGANIRLFQAEVEKIITEAQNRGSIRSDISAAGITDLFTGFVIPAVMMYYMRSGRVDINRTIEEKWALFLKLVAI